LALLRLSYVGATQCEYLEDVVELAVDVSDDIDRPLHEEYIAFFSQDLSESLADLPDGIFCNGPSLLDVLDDALVIHLNGWFIYNSSSFNMRVKMSLGEREATEGVEGLG
jgi:hypothetical protein